MTVEQKKEALLKALGEVWDRMFYDWKWEESKDNSKVFELSGKDGPYDFVPYLAGCRDAWSSRVCIEYRPEEDIVGLYIKERPIKAEFKDELLRLFDKYSPFGMKLSFDNKLAPIMSREEKVEVKDFPAFLGEFRKAYDEYYPVFYMVTVCAIEWYDGFGFRCYDWGNNY